MSGILDLLNGPIGQTIINGVAGSTGQDSSKTSSVLTMALPVLMKAMERNASTPEGAAGLMGAINKHDGGILDNLSGLFGGGVDEAERSVQHTYEENTVHKGLLQRYSLVGWRDTNQPTDKCVCTARRCRWAEISS